MRICVVNDFDAGRKMHEIMNANLGKGNVVLTSTQLKILSMITALHEELVPSDVQQKIDAIPTGEMMENGNCPFYYKIGDMRIHLIQKNMHRYQRKRRFLDVLKSLQYLQASHHTIGVSYYDRKLQELENQLQKIQISSK